MFRNTNRMIGARVAYSSLALRVSVLVTAILCCASVARAEGPRVLPEGETPKDWRLDKLKDYDGYFPFTPPESKEEWGQRAERVRRQLKVALGIWPEPERTPLNAVIHGKIDKGEYTVEKVFFESVPGFYVTGNLYRPKGMKGKKPGVLCPHGHWSNGRFYDAGEEGVKKQIAQGAEKHEEGGRSPLQARAVTLARLGCVVFHYDMLGYADSTQISFELVHRFAKQRPEANDSDNWGFYSPQAEAHLQSVMGLQIWSGMRALDFLETLPDVDKSRLAVTGSSGGGTQTMILGAVDPRPAAIVPAVMVSTAMQGGCTCESCSLLRVDTGNVEFAALFAPKPQLMTAADDWTREMKTKGFPDLIKHYKLLGAEENVALSNLVQFKHNYNLPNRKAMYHWFNKHLQLGQEEPIVEQDYERLSQEEMTVWNDDHPRPEGGDEYEKRLVGWLTEDAQKQLNKTIPKDEKSLRQFDEIVGGAIDVMIGRGLPDPKEIEYKQSIKNDEGDFLEMAGVLNLKVSDDKQEQLPIAFLYPKDWNKQVVIWIDSRGKAGLYREDGPIIEPVKKLMREGTCVIGVDLLYQGEFLADGKPVETTRKVGNPREAACYTFGYNNSLFARRVQDILTVVSYVKNHGLAADEVVVVGLGKDAGPLVAAARAQADDAIDRAVIDTAGFRFADVDDIHSPRFLPGGAKYFDVPGMLAVGAPEKTWLAGEGQGSSPLTDAYAAAGAKENLVIYENDVRDGKGQQMMLDAAVQWIQK